MGSVLKVYGRDERYFKRVCDQVLRRWGASEYTTEMMRGLPGQSARTRVTVVKIIAKALQIGWQTVSFHAHESMRGHLKTPVLLLCGLLPSLLGRAAYEPANLIPPKPVREFRAAWVASVANIDWPSSRKLSAAEQKAELLAILDRATQLKLNAIVLQVRPACDALYASDLEPWSEFLTGTMGKAPEPFYDPLAFAVEEAHKRALELHAWFNPYRAGHTSAKAAPSANHVSRTHPQWVRRYGSQVWLDPGEKEAQEYSLKVVLDVVRRYDIDGVHFDDYFYPYKENGASGQEMDFPDEVSWKKFGAGGKLSRGDWRRENVNAFIERVYSSIKATKPWVKFGISPFGIWRPGHPAQIEGFDAYDKLFADSKKWLNRGWVDYFAPQLYWAIDPPEQRFPALLKWWMDQNTKDRLIVPGMDATKTMSRRRSGERQGWPSVEIVNQVRITRQQSGAAGHIYWNMSSLMRNTGLCDSLGEVYKQPALTPNCPWLDNAPPAKPVLSVVQEQTKGRAARLKVNWSTAGTEKPWLWLLQFRDSEWKTQVLPGSKSSFTWLVSAPEAVAITAVDRCGNCSATTVIRSKR